jgi:hypothetical protein
VTTTVHLARIGTGKTMHHVVEPRPLRGTPEQVKARCGQRGVPTALVTNIDAKAVRVREGVVCVSCMELAEASQ